jgi:hypothetical protein
MVLLKEIVFAWCCQRDGFLKEWSSSKSIGSRSIGVWEWKPHTMQTTSAMSSVCGSHVVKDLQGEGETRMGRSPSRLASPHVVP